MANPTAAIQQVRRARMRLDAPPPRNFDRYRPEYEAILEATAAVAGEPGFDQLRKWMVETTKERQRLPTPDEVRTHAREVCSTHGIAIPRNSPLRG